MNSLPIKAEYKCDIGLLTYISDLFGKVSGENVFGEYVRHLRTESDVSERTIEVYVKDLFGTYDPANRFIRSAEYTFFTFLNRESIQFKQQIDREVIRNYIVWLSANGIGKSSINRRLSAVRSFFKFLLIEGLIDNSPIPVNTRQRNSPRSSLSVKIDRRIPVFLTLEEINKLILAPDTTRPEGKRDRAILELLYASGLRVSEIQQLNLGSINLDTREVRVLGKGSKERIVLMGMPAADALRDYILNSRPQLCSSRARDALFLNYQGQRLSVRWIQKQLRRYASSVGLEKCVHPHVLRHTFATHMLDGGADLRVVQELLGHADLSSTQIYTHVTRQQARKVYLKSHPMTQEKDCSNE